MLILLHYQRKLSLILPINYLHLVWKLPMDYVGELANQLYTFHLINSDVKENCSMEAFVTEFKVSLSFKRKLPQVQVHCQKFLNSFIAVRGSYADAAEALAEDWIEAIRNELGFDFNIDIDD